MQPSGKEQDRCQREKQNGQGAVGQNGGEGCTEKMVRMERR